MKEFPPKEIQKLVEQLLHIKQEKNTSKWVEEADVQSPHKLYPLQSEGNS